MDEKSTCEDCHKPKTGFTCVNIRRNDQVLCNDCWKSKNVDKSIWSDDEETEEDRKCVKCDKRVLKGSRCEMCKMLYHYYVKEQTKNQWMTVGFLSAKSAELHAPSVMNSKHTRQKATKVKEYEIHYEL